MFDVLQAYSLKFACSMIKRDVVNVMHPLRYIQEPPQTGQLVVYCRQAHMTHAASRLVQVQGLITCAIPSSIPAI